ncbi:hypothetical protein F4777DRAFT_297592 [Nemania sp. FL0916]|nr:hypothetical protein F4777DRAFT_297592 [Nemania sp. FL0916]
MGVTSGIGHLIESVGEMVQGVFAAILHMFEFVFNSIMGLFGAFVNFVEGTLGFAIHNFFILGTVAAVVFGYLLYSQRQGTTPVSRTIKNKN